MSKPDLTLLLAQTLAFLDEGEAAWRRIRDRGEPIVVEPADADELLAKFATGRSALEAVEAIIAAREDMQRNVFRTMVTGFGTLAQGLMALSACATGQAERELYQVLADAVLNLGRTAAIGAMGIDGPPPAPPTPQSGPARGWTPTILPGGAA